MELKGRVFTKQCLKSDCSDGRSVLKWAPQGRVSICFPERVRLEGSGAGGWSLGVPGTGAE